MEHVNKYIRKYLLPIIIIILIIPTFWKMLPYGMFSTQDFHIFRLVEFDKCVKSLQIPCRWSPDAGLGYGEPLFNFYGQFVYVIGEVFHLLGANIVNSIKLLFILSLVGSGIAMYFLAKAIWKDNAAAALSSVIYVYAPYRAVDVFVRGALPEAFAFILFPLVLLAVEKKSLGWFSILVAVLIITHNLSLVMFMPVLLVWIFYRKFWKGLLGLCFAALISAFYILPVAFESKFIDLNSTITGYFDFHNHFVTSFELFVSNFWGYGASVWGPNDGLSLSVGYVQWILPLFILFNTIYRYIVNRDKRFLTENLAFLILFAVGWIYIFLTHNKSTFIWEHLPFMSYIQFPWRFLGMVVFCFSLSAGAISKISNKWKLWLTIVISATAIALNFQFFRPDVWYKVGDSYYTTGAEWVRQRTASIGDFWPNFGHTIPKNPSDGKYINYFPGWVSRISEQGGLIPAAGSKFTDTPVRSMGNIISLVSIIAFLAIVSIPKRWKEKI